jgi:hypothetical protein
MSDYAHNSPEYVRDMAEDTVFVSSECNIPGSYDVVTIRDPVAFAYPASLTHTVNGNPPPRVREGKSLLADIDDDTGVYDFHENCTLTLETDVVDSHLHIESEDIDQRKQMIRTINYKRTVKITASGALSNLALGLPEFFSGARVKSTVYSDNNKGAWSTAPPHNIFVSVSPASYFHLWSFSSSWYLVGGACAALHVLPFQNQHHLRCGCFA